MLITELKKLKVFKRGKFILKRGEVSDFYIDIKKAFGSPKAFELIVNKMAKVVDKRVTCVAGSGHGGLPLATAISLKLGLPLILVRDGSKNHGLKKMIDGYVPHKKDRVAIVDDVFTTGTCINNIVGILRKTKSKIVAAYVVVNRGDVSGLRVPVKSLLTLQIFDE